jgi:ppGpp synthetase/RelA/SpoT-type nucleotidyltranferase
MDIEEYAKSGQHLYAGFAEAVGNILERAIAAADLKATEPQLQHRAKDMVRLQARLEEKGLGGAQNIEEIRKDLAGCRLIFYTNGDLAAFLQTGILRDNFEIDSDSTKIHHPTPSAETVSQHRGYNFVVRLKESRTDLPEYARFSGLRCEIQLQTILNHAWSETSHDIVYKQPIGADYAKKAMAQIEKRFNDIMLKYLVPAGHEFEKAKHDFNNLMEGRPIFEKGPLKALRDAKDNNERKDVLERIHNHYLPNHDDPQPLLPELYTTVEEAVTLSRGTAAAPIKTTFGAIDGWTGDHVVGAAMDLLDSFRYADPEATLDLLMRLSRAAQGQKERQRMLKSAESLATVPIKIFRQVGGKIQLLLTRKLTGLGKEDRECFRDLILTVCDEVLRPDINGTTSSYRTVTFERGALPANKDIEVARIEAIELLKSLYREATTDAQWMAVLNHLALASRTPTQGNYSNALLAMILKDSIRVLAFLAEVVVGVSFELKKAIESDAWETYRTLGQAAFTDDAEGELGGLQAELSKAIQGVRDILDEDAEFEIFKTLVSLNAIYPRAWDTARPDFRSDDAWRQERIGRYLECFTKETEDEWWQRLDRCASSRTNDGASYRGLQEFLKRAAETKPELVLPRLDSLSEPMVRFLPTILPGLWRSKLKVDLHEVLVRWANQGKHLGAIAVHYAMTKEPDLNVLSAVFESAKKAGDLCAALALVGTLVDTYAQLGPPRKQLLLSALKWLQSHDNTDWVNEAWFVDEGLKAFVNDMNSAERAAVLETLVAHPKADHHVDYILLPFARVDLPCVLTYFGARLGYAARKPDDLKYEAIPYALAEMKPMQDAPEPVLDAALGWIQEDANRSHRGADSFVHAVFPQITDQLASALIKRGTSGNRNQTEGVLDVLSTYEGTERVYDICREIVGSIDPNDEALLDKVSFSLQHTGVVSGEFGFVEAYAAQKALLEKWLTDSRASVRAFATKLISGFDKAIASEQDRAEQRMALEKLNWGESIT